MEPCSANVRDVVMRDSLCLIGCIHLALVFAYEFNELGNLGGVKIDLTKETCVQVAESMAIDAGHKDPDIHGLL